MLRPILCSMFLLAHTVTDLQERKIYTVLLHIQIAVGILLCLCLSVSWLQTGLAAIPGLLCLLCGKATDEKIGYGDGWMLIACAFYETPEQINGQLLAACSGAFVYALFLILLCREKEPEIPFAPFLFLGCIGGILNGS